MSRQRILHVVDTLGMGGAETWLIEVLRHIRREGVPDIEMDFLATSGNSGIFDDEARTLGAKVHYLPFSRSRLGEFTAAFRKILQEGRYTVLHDHQGFAGGWHFLFGSGVLPPVRIAHFHNAVYQIDADLRSRRAMTALGAALVERFATHIVGTSHDVLVDYGFLDGRFKGTIKGPIYCGFDPERFREDRGEARRKVLREFGWPKDSLLVLLAGRADQSPDLHNPNNCKNTAFSVDVALAAARQEPRLRILFAGETSAAVPVLEQKIADAGFAEQIRFAGIRRDIEGLMVAADALLFPSRGEGLGLVAVEAQAAGLPVLASTAVPRECVVVPELVMFHDLSAGADAWAADLLKLTKRPRDPDRANRSVAESRFSIGRSADALIRLYASGRVDADPSMRVLHVVDTLGMGGAETWMMEVLRFLHRSGGRPLQIDFLATSGKPGVFDEEARALGAKIHYLRFGRSEVGRFARGFRRLLKRGGYAAIHDHQAYASGWHFLLGAGLLPPVRIAHVHNPTYQVAELSWSRRVVNRLGALLIRRYATSVAATSQQVLDEYGFGASEFREVPKGPVYCGFDPQRFLRDRADDSRSVREEFGWPADAKLVLFAGRIDQSPDVGDPLNHKNSGFAVSVGLAAARRDARVRLLFAGQPSPAVAVLQARIAEAGLSDRFVFAGIRKDIERLMGASDVLLFPSRAEGLGMVAVEAQAAGLPVLASSAVPRECMVVPELMQFRDLADPVETWAADLLQLADRPREASRANSQVAGSHFSIAYSAETLCRLYAGEGAGP